MVATDNQLPDWALWVQAMGPTAVSGVTTMVAIGVAIVAYRQWRVSKEKLALDLFERRLAIYFSAKAGVDKVIRDGDVRSNDGIKDIVIAQAEAQFLFGDEVLAYFDRLKEEMANVGLAHDMMQGHDTSEDWPKNNFESMSYISRFYDDFPALLAPYMRMTQKVR